MQVRAADRAADRVSSRDVCARRAALWLPVRAITHNPRVTKKRPKLRLLKKYKKIEKEEEKKKKEQDADREFPRLGAKRAASRRSSGCCSLMDEAR